MSTSESLELRKETVTGFVDRGNNFRPGEADTFLADRWVSDYFNIRNLEGATPDEPGCDAAGGKVEEDAGENRLVLCRETIRGFVDRGNQYQADERGSMVADRWVGSYHNVRSNS